MTHVSNVSDNHSNSGLAIAVVVIVLILVVCLFICGFRIWRKRFSNQLVYTKGLKQPLLTETGGIILSDENDIEQNYSLKNTRGSTSQNITNNDSDVVESINKMDETSTGYSTSTVRDGNITSGGDIELLDVINKNKTVELVQTDANVLQKQEKYAGDSNEQNEIENVGSSTIGASEDEHKEAVVKDVYISDQKEFKNEGNEKTDVTKSVVENVGKCVVCMDKPTQYACIPGGHHCLCETCKDMIDNKCPICMTTCTVFKILK